MKTQSVTEVIWGDMDLLRSSAVTSPVRAYTTKLLTFCLFFLLKLFYLVFRIQQQGIIYRELPVLPAHLNPASHLGMISLEFQPGFYDELLSSCNQSLGYYAALFACLVFFVRIVTCDWQTSTVPQRIPHQNAIVWKKAATCYKMCNCKSERFFQVVVTVQVSGKMRAILKPLVAQAPFIGAVSVFFLNKPVRV